MTTGVKSSKVAPTSRAERARATRMRILRAAYSLFAAQGYPMVTMAAVAAEAGVAVQTLYFTFGTKAELLQHAYDYAVLGDGEAVPPTEQSWYRDMHVAEDLGEALRILVENVGAVMARTAPLDEFVRAASIEPEPARVRQATEIRRREAWRDMVQSLGGRFPLRDGLTVERATDVLMVVMSPSTYQNFVGLYGWTPAEWQEWCAQALSTQVFQAHRSRDGF
jgi:AcrR family transcriptional regulator